MKLKSILILGIIISIFSITILIYSFLHISQQYSYANEKSSVVNQLHTGFLELNVLTGDYLLYKNQRPFEQWLKRHASLHQLVMVKKVLFPSHYYQNMLDSFTQSHKLIINLKKLNDQYHKNINNLFVSYQTQALGSQLQTVVQTMSSTTHHLSNQHHNHFYKIILSLKQTILIIIIALSLLVIMVFYIFISRIYKPIQYLNQHVENFVPNLGYRLKLKHKDELGNLANTLNNMAEKLQKTMYERDKMTYQAQHDPLTGLANRLLCIDRLSQTLKIAARNNHKIAVIFIDLDNFKHINDHFGHQVGDEVLKHVASSIINHIRKADHIARIGGDEFMLILNDISEKNRVNEILDHINEEFCLPLESQNHSIKISLSMGISLYPDNGLDRDELISFADKAMYQSKKMGRNTYCYYSPENKKEVN